MMTIVAGASGSMRASQFVAHLTDRGGERVSGHYRRHSTRKLFFQRLVPAASISSMSTRRISRA
jgi:uncharacterized membrane protein YsdA (DUF1294 family)